MQVRVQVNSEFIKRGNTDDIHDLMVRYIHFGELNKHSFNKVYLEISMFVKDQNSKLENNEGNKLSPKAILRLYTPQR
jgi:hypothetical protein